LRHLPAKQRSDPLSVSGDSYNSARKQDSIGVKILEETSTKSSGLPNSNIVVGGEMISLIFTAFRGLYLRWVCNRIPYSVQKAIFISAFVNGKLI
jgi:hypothetical protein